MGRDTAARRRAEPLDLWGVQLESLRFAARVRSTSPTEWGVRREAPTPSDRTAKPGALPTSPQAE
eukprot:3206670-Alexandrium_andersonii.AAC.1